MTQPNTEENRPVTSDATRKFEKDYGEGSAIRTVIYAILIAVVIRTVAFEPFNIPSGSMMPGLQVGDFLFVSKFSYGYSSRSTVLGAIPLEGRLFGKQPERGDVIVFKLPRDPSIDYIKRLIGLPGDVIAVRSGEVWINGAPLPRERIGPVMMEDKAGMPMRPAIEWRETMPNGKSYVVLEEYENAPLDNAGPFRVPEGHYFMMGDNRDNSQDSRTRNVSYVPYENLVGRAEFTFFSLSAATRFWQFWKWPWSVRWDRMFQQIQ
ncbi:MAG: signal peptidase I [Alphaproteobacteria bacterium]|nr:signal peptidase I [Alphaproteobacteria bacterium]